MSEIRLPTVHLGSTALIVNPFQVVQATWNLLERSAGAALADAKAQGWGVIVKEALANGLDRRGPADWPDIAESATEYWARRSALAWQ